MSFNRSAQNVQLTGGNLIIVDIDKKIRSSKYEFANGGSDGAGTSVNLQDVTEQGASTDRTVTFSNVTTAFTTTSNVGIGTTSLTSRLTVQGAAAAPGVLSALRLRNSSDGGIGLHFDNNVCNLANIEARVTSTGAGTDNGILSFSTSNDAVIAERMRITSSGNVSIGTENSYGKLSVLGDSSTVLDSFNIKTAATSNGVVSTVYNTNETVGSYAGIRLITRNSGASLWGIFNKSTNTDTSNLVFTHGNGGGGAERMTITSGGNVGIGGDPTNSYEGLTIKGSNPSIRFNSTSESAWNFIEYSNVNNGIEFSSGVNHSGSSEYWAVCRNSGSANLDTRDFIINSAGRVSIKGKGSGHTTYADGDTSALVIGRKDDGLHLDNVNGVNSLPTGAGVFADFNDFGSLMLKSRTQYDNYNIRFYTSSTANGDSGPQERMRITQTGAVITPFNLGKNYPQTSGSGTGTSIVDTGITYDTGDFDGYGRGATYQVVFNGNPNGGGSGAYFAQYTGFIIVHTGYDYGVSAVTTYIGYTQLASGNINIGPLTLTARFWNGSSETTSIGVFTGGAQIRIKIAGYNSAYTGLDQSVYLTRIA